MICLMNRWVDLSEIFGVKNKGDKYILKTDFFHMVYKLDMKTVPKKEVFRMFRALENKGINVEPPKEATLKN